MREGEERREEGGGEEGKSEEGTGKERASLRRRGIWRDEGANSRVERSRKKKYSREPVQA
jgi:hypothetical protein